MKNNINLAFILILLTMMSTYLRAQNIVISLQEAIEISKQNYPSMEAAQWNIEKQKAFKKVAVDLGRTGIFTGNEEYNKEFDGIQTVIGFRQEEIDVFSIPAKTKMAKSGTELAISERNMKMATLIRDVTIAYNKVVVLKQTYLLFQSLDTLYADFLRAAELRYNTQATSRLEYLSASAKQKEILVNLRRVESNLAGSYAILNQYLSIEERFDVDQAEAISYAIVSENNIVDTLSHNPLLEYYTNAIDFSMNSIKVNKAGFLPKIDLMYGIQKVEGVSGYNTFQAGISLPLLFFSQNGKNKVAYADYQIVSKERDQAALEINAIYLEKLSYLSALEDVLEYYLNEALPLSNEQIEAARLGYKLGSIDYIQFIQNIETAINTKREFLKQQGEFLDISAEIKYLTGIYP